MATLRAAVGLRSLAAGTAGISGKRRKETAAPRFVQYREDGKFRFKLVDAAGATQALSVPFDDPKAAGEAIRRLPVDGELVGRELRLDGRTVAHAELPAVATIEAAIRALAGDV
jgi:tryptophanyl-tRNA synthetase